MSEDPLRYLLEVGGIRRPCLRVRGTEAMSAPYRFVIDLQVPADDPLDPDATVGEPAVLHLVRQGTVRTITGVATRVVRRATRRGQAMGAPVEVVLEPTLALARHRVDIRVFRDKSADRIAAEVIGAFGIPVVLRLTRSYAIRPYCVQMRESDLDFVNRLLEDEGIFSFVDDDGTWVLGDEPGAYLDPLGVIPFHHGSGLDRNRDAVHELGWTGRATAGRVSLRDFNHEAPSLDMDVSVPGPTPWGPEWYDYPGEYEQPSEGAAKARLRAEALACARRRLSGRSFAGGLRPGRQFVLEGTPPGIDDGEYVVTRVEHDFTLERGFSCDFEALPATVAFRPEVVTEVPTLPNPLTGFVTGPPGADIHTDSWGRVKVHFPWDRLQPKDDHCSHWVPVLQDNTGESSAMPRIGWEVLTHFMEGDPDRPVVVGRVFNPEDPFEEELPKHKTRTSLRSQSSPRTAGATGFNMIRFEDKAGAECIDVHAERDQRVVVGNDQTEQIDSGEARIVKGNEVISIGTVHKTNVAKEDRPLVDGNRTLVVGANRDVKAKEGASTTVRGNHALTIGGSHERSMGQNDATGSKNLKESIGAIVLEGSIKTNSTAAGRVSVLAVGGAIIEIARIAKSESAMKARVEAVGGIFFTKAGENVGVRANKSRKLAVGALYSANSKKEMLIAGREKLTTKSLSAKLEAPIITLKVGETTVTLKEGKIAFNAKQGILIDTQAANTQGATTSSQQ